ncbi:glycosyltransferase family 4 protein [candidate division KSB1 bacterium]|nr:glycosyltransferase family 4 protein [candidate division KSB1 bacterium]
MKQILNMLYLSNERLPATLACTIQQMVMCEAFVRGGARVQFVHPFFGVKRHSPAEIYTFYDVTPCFEIGALFSLLSLSKPPVDGKRHVKIPLVGGVSLFISTWIFALAMLVRGRLDRPLVVYSRNVIGAAVFLKLKQRLARHKPLTIVFEAHSLDQQPKRFFHKLLRESDGLICITKALRDALVRKYGVSVEKTLVAPDGVRASLLHRPVLAKEEARRRLNITAQRLVLYTGQLLPGKGAEVFVEAARYVDENTQFMIVGGHGEYAKQLQDSVRERNLSNVTLTGFVPPTQVPLYQSAADVLVLPATADHAISAYTSPLKLFEYMAIRRPILASNLAVLQEVLQDGVSALLFQERDAVDLAAKVKLLLDDDELQGRLVHGAWERVQSYTWEERARRILEFIQGGTVR